jgi:hypothetical protein
MLRYPSHLFQPENSLSFIESEVFGVAGKRCRLTDDDLFELQLSIAALPKAGAVIEGTGGVRKLRFSPAASRHGKAGSHRALYCYFEKHGIVLLVTAYPKSKKDDISMAGRKAMKKMMERQHELLSAGPIK